MLRRAVLNGAVQASARRGGFIKGQLHDTVVIVTGGGTGIGEAVCRKFAREGARVVVNGLPDDPITDVVAAILDDGGTAIPFVGDVSDDATARACVETTIDEYGRLDVLINNAGVLLGLRPSTCSTPRTARATKRS
jgi:NAD(P)-dependent dehydrogenase (short-subunit alcohol dehydrogenase family)